MDTNITTINQYISNAPPASQEALKQIRKIIQKVAPTAKESINYGIPTYQLDAKKKMHFGGYAKHVGIYPTPPVVAAFADLLQGYATAKGSIQFQLSEPIPYDLIEQLAKAALVDKE